MTASTMGATLCLFVFICFCLFLLFGSVFALLVSPKFAEFFAVFVFFLHVLFLLTYIVSLDIYKGCLWTLCLCSTVRELLRGFFSSSYVVIV